MNDPRILIISHNVFSQTNNMGKTLSAYFAKWDSDSLAQFYIHSEVPTVDICKRYYRITDKDALKSIISGYSGTIFAERDIEKTRTSSRTDEGKEAQIYQKARRRTPGIYLMRNIWWSLAHWNTHRLKQWLDDFQPDIVFLAAGDYSFIYKIAVRIAKDRNIPLVVSCVDDYYLYNKNERFFGGKLTYKLYMRKVNETMAYASAIFCISDTMCRAYKKLFGKSCYTLHTPSMLEKPLSNVHTSKISYIGNLGWQRDKQLIEIGQALSSLSLEPNHIDVYSPEKRPEILKGLVEARGVVFHGGISPTEVKKVMAESLAIVHTESFDDTVRKTVKYSISTKIADSLASGTCIFAYGPAEIASMEYLSDNDAAICVTEKSELAVGLTSLLCNAQLRERVVKNAIALSKKDDRDVLRQVCFDLSSER